DDPLDGPRHDITSPVVEVHRILGERAGEEETHAALRGGHAPCGAAAPRVPPSHRPPALLTSVRVAPSAPPLRGIRRGRYDRFLPSPPRTGPSDGPRAHREPARPLSRGGPGGPSPAPGPLSADSAPLGPRPAAGPRPPIGRHRRPCADRAG